MNHRNQQKGGKNDRIFILGIAWKNFPTLVRATPTPFKILGSANDISINLVTPIVRSPSGRLTDKSQCYSCCLLCLPTFFQGILMLCCRCLVDFIPADIVFLRTVSLRSCILGVPCTIIFGIMEAYGL